MINLFFWSLAIVIGTAFLVKGADLLVDSGGSTARYFGVPVVIVGLTLVSFGTSLPELAASLNASLIDKSGISLGNVIGSNIANTLLVVGASSLISPLELDNKLIKREIPIMFLAFLGFVLVLIIGDNVVAIEGFFLLLLFVLYLVFFGKIALNSENSAKIEEEIVDEKYMEVDEFNLPLETIKIIIGILGIVIGSQLLIKGAVFYMETFNLNQSMVGLSIVAISTSLPEMAASAIASFKKESNISLGNVIGSNAFNILLVVGACSIFVPLEVTPTILLYSAIMIIAGLALTVFMYVGKNINRLEGAIMFISYFVFLYSLYIFF